MMSGLPPISNYKGVMLCDRPSAEAAPSRPNSFISAVKQHEPLGLNPAKALVLAAGNAGGKKAPDKTSALYKHRQWLSQLQKDIKGQKAAEEEEASRKSQQRRKFLQYSSQLREAIRVAVNVEPTLALARQPEEQPQQRQPEPPLEPEPGAERPADVPALDLKSKPAWALTEDQVDMKLDLEEEEDVEDLLDFVGDLDFETYVDDYEVRAALEVMKSRIVKLDTQRSRVENDDGSGEAGEAAGEPASGELGAEGERDKETGWNKPEAEISRPYTSESMQQANQILDSARDLGKVHSAASLATKLTGLKEQEADEGRGAKREIDPSNLPYLHRNPGI